MVNLDNKENSDALFLKEKYEEMAGRTIKFDTVSRLEADGNVYIIGQKGGKVVNRDGIFEPHDVSKAEIMALRLKDGEPCGEPLWISASSNAKYWWEDTRNDAFGTTPARNSIQVRAGAAFFSDVSARSIDFSHQREGFVDFSNPAVITAMMSGGVENSEGEIALRLCQTFIPASDSQKEAAAVERRRWQTAMAEDKIYQARKAADEKKNARLTSRLDEKGKPAKFLRRFTGFFR